MPRSSKTSNVLKMLNLPAEEKARKVNSGVKPKPAHTVIPQEPEIPLLPVKRKPRKNITKHLNIEKLAETAENPAFIIPEEGKVYNRAFNERQIVSIPLMLINEQLGAAVERFNSCACDECLREIIIRAFRLLPPMYVRVVNNPDEEEVNRLIKEHRPEVIRTLAKICITANKKPFHDEVEELD